MDYGVASTVNRSISHGLNFLFAGCIYIVSTQLIVCNEKLYLFYCPVKLTFLVYFGPPFGLSPSRAHTPPLTIHPHAPPLTIHPHAAASLMLLLTAFPTSSTIVSNPDLFLPSCHFGVGGVDPSLPPLQKGRTACKVGSASCLRALLTFF